MSHLFDLRLHDVVECQRRVEVPVEGASAEQGALRGVISVYGTRSSSGR